MSLAMATAFTAWLTADAPMDRMRTVFSWRTTRWVSTVAKDLALLDPLTLRSGSACAESSSREMICPVAVPIVCAS